MTTNLTGTVGQDFTAGAAKAFSGIFVSNSLRLRGSTPPPDTTELPMTTNTDRMTAARHPRKARTAAVDAVIDADRRAARDARRAGDLDEAWRLLERVHILSQPWAWPHVRSHVDMLRLALHARDRRELVGQMVRTVVAGPGSAVGRYPLGNTGRSNVPAMQPMPLPEDLAGLLMNG